MEQRLSTRVSIDIRRPGSKARRGHPSLTFGAILFFGSCGQAMAYTDPGSGALLWQLVMAAFLGSMFYLRKLTAWFKASIRKKDH